jgi:adenylate cyclase
VTNIQSSLQNSYRKLSRLSYGANFLGALITFIYLSVIDPIPQGGASVRTLEPVDLLFFGIAVAVIFAVATLLGNWLQRPFRNWQRQLESGPPPGDIPQKVASRILNWPLISSALMAGIWLISAVLFSYFYDNPSAFIGIAIGGLVTIAIIYAGSDLLWRDVIQQFFPSAILSDVPAIRLWVQRRLLLGFILIGAITPILLVILTVERSRELMAASNPQVVFNNLVIVLIFILAVGLSTGVIVAVLVARAIVEPIQVLRRAMSQVENNELDTRVPVTTNDELGFLGERFN